MTVCSPWQWFCSTRTLSNCVETTYTIVALEYWPWQWSLDSEDTEIAGNEGPQERTNKDAIDQKVKEQEDKENEDNTSREPEKEQEVIDKEETVEEKVIADEAWKCVNYTGKERRSE